VALKRNGLKIEVDLRDNMKVETLGSDKGRESYEM
jgi:hypothetical protein